MKEIKLFGIKKPVIGMIHVPALPGTPKCDNKDFKEVIKIVLEEAKLYKSNGVDAIAIENMHDVPYLNRKVGPEITAAMSILGYEVKNKTGLPCGIQILAGANKEAMAAAYAAGLDFIRAEGFVFAHIADEGFINSGAGELLRYRKFINAEHIKVFTDVKKKHSSHSITSDVDIVETAKAAEFFLSDGIIVTGKSTAIKPDIREVKQVKEAVQLPVIIGSGINRENIEDYFTIADAFIVGSYFKIDGLWSNKLDKQRIKDFMKLIHRLR